MHLISSSTDARRNIFQRGCPTRGKQRFDCHRLIHVTEGHFVGDKAFELFVRHTNKDASEAPTLPHTLVSQKITNIDLGITSKNT